MLIVAVIPARSDGELGRGSNLNRRGTRWTTFTQLPVAF